MLLEYNFYLPNKEEGVDEQAAPGDDNPEDTNVNPDPTAPADPTADPTADAGTPPVGGEDPTIPGDNPTPDTTPAPTGMDTPPPMDGAPAPDGSTPPMDTAPMTDTAPPPMDTAPMGGDQGGDVEVDITDLVTSTQDSNQKIDGLNQSLNNILQKFDELEGRISSVDQIISKMDDIEHQVEKRLPTPVEKLELRSLDSYPYNIKLSDFWSDKNQELGIEEPNDKQQGEFTLTQDDVMGDYDSMAIKASFDVKDQEDQNFK